MMNDESENRFSSLFPLPSSLNFPLCPSVFSVVQKALLGFQTISATPRR